MHFKKMEKVPLFWRLQIIGWVLFIVLTFPTKLIVCGSLSEAIGSSILRDGGSFLMTLLMRIIYRIIYRSHKEPLWIVSSILIVSSGAALTQLPPFFWCGKIFPYEEETIFGNYAAMGVLFFRGGQFLGWSVLYFGIKIWLDKEADELRLEQEKAKRNDAELLMLRSLINSHFLVNSLNTVLNVLERQTQGAREMVQSLSNYLNYSLRHRMDNLVPLGEEVEALDDYLALEKARLGHELNFDERVEADLRSTEVPGFLLQPLIENAIKYGRETCCGTVLVRLMILREGDDLLLQVFNTGKWILPDPHRKSGGIGFEVIQRKLAWMYPNRHSLTTLDEEGWVMVQIKIPIIP